MSVHSVWKVDGYLLGTTASKYYSSTLPFRISRSISFDLFHLGGVTIQLGDTNILGGKGNEVDGCKRTRGNNNNESSSPSLWNREDTTTHANSSLNAIGNDFRLLCPLLRNFGQYNNTLLAFHEGIKRTEFPGRLIVWVEWPWHFINYSAQKSGELEGRMFRAYSFSGHLTKI